MAHTFGNNSARSSLATAPNVISFTPAAGSTVLWLGMVYAGTVDRAGGAPTFNGVALLQGNGPARAAASPETTVEDWYMLDPPIVTADISIPNTGTAKTIRSVIATGKAASGFTSAIDDGQGNSGTSTNPGIVLTPTVGGDILFAVVGTGAQTWAPSAQSGTNLFNTDAGANGDGFQYALRSVSGAFTLGWTFGTSEDWACLGKAFKEVAATQLAAATAARIDVSAPAPVVVPGAVSALATAAIINVSAIAAAPVAGGVSRTATAASVDVSASAAGRVSAITAIATAGTVDISAPSAARAPGGVSRTATPAIVDVSAVTPARVPGAVSRSATAASIDVSAITPTRIAGTVARSATAASIDVTAPTPDASLSGGGGQSRTATAAQINISAVSAERIAGSVVRSATAGLINISAVTPERIPGAVFRTASAGLIDVSAPIALRAPGAVSRTASAATVNVSAITPDRIAGAVAQSATAASIDVSAPTATGDTGAGGAQSRTATAATVNVSAIAPSLIPGAVLRSATAATIQISAPTPTTEGGIIVEPPPPPVPGASFVGVRRRVLRGRKYQEQIVDIFFALGAVIASDRVSETYPRFVDVQVDLGMNLDSEGFSISGTIERPDLGLRAMDQDIRDIIDLAMLGEI